MPDMHSPYDDPNHWARVYLEYEVTRTEMPKTEDKQPVSDDDYLAEMDTDGETLREVYERMGKTQ